MPWSWRLPHSAELAGPDRDRVDAAERELRAFSYIVSHDLAASFRQVAGFSRLLLGELGERLTERQQSQVDHIRAATEKCQLMMEQLLALSRVQQNDLNVLRLDATKLASLAELQLDAEIRAAGADVTIEALGEVDGDPTLLAQAFRRLLENAIKFRVPGVAPRIVVQASDDADGWRLRITDNGPGVAPAFRERAFGMFQRLNAEGSHPGVGAGLAICRRIARRHGGEARFVDTDRGACVEMVLPRRPAPQ